MLDALIGLWIGTTALSLSTGSAYCIGGSSLLDDVPMHCGEWTSRDNIIEFKPAPGSTFRDTIAVRRWHGPFRCAYTVEHRVLTLSECPYQGGYVPRRSPTIVPR